MCNLAAPNSANTEWVIKDGQISLASDNSLCLTGPRNPSRIASLVTIEPCESNNTLQQFTITNSTTSPSVQISQGLGVLGTSGSSIVLFPPDTGAGVFPCNASDPLQNIFFTGGGTSPGQLRTAAGFCVSGACYSESCYPIPFVPCNSSDTIQLWTHTFYNFFVNVQTGDCLDAYNEEV